MQLISFLLLHKLLRGRHNTFQGITLAKHSFVTHTASCTTSLVLVMSSIRLLAMLATPVSLPLPAADSQAKPEDCLLKAAHFGLCNQTHSFERRLSKWVFNILERFVLPNRARKVSKRLRCTLTRFPPPKVQAVISAVKKDQSRILPRPAMAPLCIKPVHFSSRSLLSWQFFCCSQTNHHIITSKVVSRERQNAVLNSRGSTRSRERTEG